MVQRHLTIRPAPAAAGLATAASGFAWHGLAAQVDPWRVPHGELDVPFRLRPTAEVSALSLLMAASVMLRRPSLARHAGRLWRGVPLHAAAGAIGVLSATALGLGDAICPDNLAGASIAAACVGAPAMPGAPRRDLPTPPVRRWMPAPGKGPGHV